MRSEKNVVLIGGYGTRSVGKTRPLSKKSRKGTAKNIGKIETSSSQRTVNVEKIRRGKSEKQSTTDVEMLVSKLPNLLTPLNLSSPEAKLAQLSLLDDTLMSLSLVADSLQKRVQRTDELHSPEIVTALCQTSKEIRSIVQLKLEIAKEFARLEMQKIRLAARLNFGGDQ